MKLLSRILLAFVCFGLAATSYAKDPETCQTVHFADVGWTDIAATTGLASVVFKGLGYKPEKTIASVPISFTGLKTGQLDVFLGYWTPSMTPIAEPFIKKGQIKVLAKPNLEGAKYTLAVPKYVYDAGLQSFQDIAKYADKLDNKIYGIEPGNDGNALILKMIDNNTFGLGEFNLVPSSEAGMLVAIRRAIKRKKWIVFLGWEPHPMNVKHDIAYLKGGDTIFGPNYGSARVFTAVSPDYLTRCPNAGKLVQNLTFTTDIENHVMVSIMDKTEPNQAATAWLEKHPQVLNKWLAGVSTFDGKTDGLTAVKAYLAKH